MCKRVSVAPGRALVGFLFDWGRCTSAVQRLVGAWVLVAEGGDLICQACHPDLMFRMSLNPSQDPDLMSSSSIWS